MRVPIASVVVLVVLAWNSTVSAQGSREPDPVMWEFQLERAEMRIRHAEAEVQRASAELEWAKRLSAQQEVGQLAVTRPLRGGRQEYRPVTLEVERYERGKVEAQAELKLRKLDLEEMEIRGGPARTSLWTRLLGGRDFVSERMNIELGVLNHAIGVVKSRHDACKILVEQRAMPWRDLAGLAVELADLTGRAERLKLRLELRELFLNGALPPDANFILREEELDRRQALLDAQVANARNHVIEIEPLVISGYAGQIDEDEARAEVRRLTQRLEHLDLDRRIFEYQLAQWLAARSK